MIVEIIFNFFKRLMVSMIKALNLQNNKVLRKSFSDRCVLTKNLNSNPLKTDELMEVFATVFSRFLTKSDI